MISPLSSLASMSIFISFLPWLMLCLMVSGLGIPSNWDLFYFSSCSANFWLSLPIGLKPIDRYGYISLNVLWKWGYLMVKPACENIMAPLPPQLKYCLMIPMLLSFRSNLSMNVRLFSYWGPSSMNIVSMRLLGLLLTTSITAP